MPSFLQDEIYLMVTEVSERQQILKSAGEQKKQNKKEESILTVAAPLTCTDLLAVDRVPGTRSTDSCTSFGFTSVTFTSLE